MKAKRISDKQETAEYHGFFFQTSKNYSTISYINFLFFMTRKGNERKPIDTQNVLLTMA